MKKKVYVQRRYFFDFEKELNYLNEMNNKGWKLVSIKFGFIYSFVKSKLDEYITALDCKSPKDDEKQKIYENLGFEILPNRLDGIGKLAYLTAKKDEKTTTFVKNEKRQAQVNNRYIKYYNLVLYLSVFGCAIDTFIIYKSIWLLNLCLRASADINMQKGIVFGIVALGIGLASFVFLSIMIIKISVSIKQSYNRIKLFKTKQIEMQ